MPIIKIITKVNPSIAFEKIKDIASTIEQGFTIKLRDDPFYRNEVIVIEKALKALEIIQETPEFAWYVKIYENAYEMIGDRIGFRAKESAEELQKKFNLLKEVLSL